MTVRRPNRYGRGTGREGGDCARHRGDRRYDPDGRRRDSQRGEIEVEVDPIEAQGGAGDERRDEEQAGVTMEPSDDAEGRRPGPTGWAAHAAPSGQSIELHGHLLRGPCEGRPAGRWAPTSRRMSEREERRP